MSLKVSTSGYPGKELKKNILVSSNDPKNPSVTLSISGYVERFVDIRPKYVRLSGAVGRKVRVPVTIVPEKKYSFRITEANALKGKDIQFYLTEKKFPGGDGYQLIVENIKTDKGRYQDVISLKTDSSIQPVIKVRVYGNIVDPEADQKNTGNTESESE